VTDAETSSGTQVSAIVEQPNGGTIVAGTFLKTRGLLRGNLLRLQADGSLDPNWNPSTDKVFTHSPWTATVMGTRAVCSRVSTDNRGARSPRRSERIMPIKFD